METEFRTGPYQEYQGQVLTKPCIAPVVLDERGVDRNERWWTIPEFPDYSVSSRGRMMSTRKGEPYIMKPGTDKDGYYQVILTKPGHRKCFKVHKLVAMGFKGPRPAGLVIDHIDGNNQNNDAGNLQYISVVANTRKGTEKPLVVRFPNGSVVGRYKSATEASKALGLNNAGLCRYLTRTFKGYIIQREFD